MIKIITDSTCDLPDELMSQYHIGVVPAYIIWGQEQFIDRVNMQPDQFYARLERDRVHPKTSQPNINDFSQAFDRAVQSGAEEIICITATSALTGIYQSALNAAQTATVPVHVVDSKGSTMMLGWQILAAARALETGKTTDEALFEVEKVRQRGVLLIGLETLSFLVKGGRVGDAVMRLGNLLAVKPLLAFNRDSGKIVPIALLRTHKSMVEGLYRKFVDSLENLSNLHVAVLHGNALEEAKKLAELIRTELHPVEFILNITGPALGVHSGPGALALCGYYDAE